MSDDTRPVLYANEDAAPHRRAMRDAAVALAEASAMYWDAPCEETWQPVLAALAAYRTARARLEGE